MRLITHNMLKSNIKGVETGFPLGIEVVKTEEHELEFNAGVGFGVWGVGELRLAAGQSHRAIRLFRIHDDCWDASRPLVCGLCIVCRSPRTSRNLEQHVTM